MAKAGDGKLLKGICQNVLIETNALQIEPLRRDIKQVVNMMQSDFISSDSQKRHYHKVEDQFTVVGRNYSKLAQDLTNIEIKFDELLEKHMTIECFYDIQAKAQLEIDNRFARLLPTKVFDDFITKYEANQSSLQEATQQQA